MRQPTQVTLRNLGERIVGARVQAASSRAGLYSRARRLGSSQAW
jgi:hypothetical protein